LFHARDFLLQIAAPQGSEAIGLLTAGTVVVFEAFDPALFEQTAQRSVERPGAEADSAIAHVFGVPEYGVTVAGLGSQAEKDEKNGLGHRFQVGFRIWFHTSLRDMSSRDILNPRNVSVKSKVQLSWVWLRAS
jgi:hypothetical protein